MKFIPEPRHAQWIIYLHFYCEVQKMNTYSIIGPELFILVIRFHFVVEFCYYQVFVLVFVLSLSCLNTMCFHVYLDHLLGSPKISGLVFQNKKRGILKTTADIFLDQREWLPQNHSGIILTSVFVAIIEIWSMTIYALEAE